MTDNVVQFFINETNGLQHDNHTNHTYNDGKWGLGGEPNSVNNDKTDYVSQQSVAFLKFISEKFAKYKATDAQRTELTCESLVKVKNYTEDDDLENDINSTKENTEPQFLRQQKLLGDYINDETGYRGILIYWGLGVGKTGAAIRIANGMPDRQVIWLLPSKGLYGNLLEEIKRFGEVRFRRRPDYIKLTPIEKEKEEESLNREIEKHHKILTYKSSKLVNKLYQLGAKTETIDPNKLLAKKGVQTEKNPLDNKLLIVDEVHNLLRQMIAEGSKIGSALFHMIMDAKNLKIVTMSGTPISDDPYNLAILFNMLRGYETIDREKYTLFPSDYEQFRNYFIDEEQNQIKNQKIFAERINGLVSFYNGIYDETSELFPTSHVHIIKCKMSSYQQSSYNEVRKKEIRADRNKQKMKGKLVKAAWKKPGRKSVMSSYRMNSRQRCNFVFPEYIERPKNLHMMAGDQKRRLILETLQSLKPEDIDPKRNLRQYSEKMYQIVTRIEESPGPCVVYSQFVELEGLGLLAKILYSIGYKQFTGTNQTQPDPKKYAEQYPDYKRKFIPRYAYFTGKNTTKHAEFLRSYNDMSNIDGSIIKVLLINVVGIEGLNLKSTRQIHYMDEYWFEDRFTQVKGRGVRMCSHYHLPKEERVVDIYRYHSVPANREDMLMEVGERETTDEYLYNLAQTRTHLMNSFLDVLKYAAFDCELNFAHNKSVLKNGCMSCYTTPEIADRKIYASNIKLHMAPGSDYGCVPSKKRELKKYIHEGQVYYLDSETKKLYSVHPETRVAVDVGYINENGRVILSR